LLRPAPLRGVSKPERPANLENAMDPSVTLGGLLLKNPVITASGTFGYGLEFAPYGDLERLGGIVVKGLSLKPREGNPVPRIAETPCGMLNAIGLQNIGVERFIRDKLPALPWKETAIIANLYGQTEEEFSTLASILSAEPGIAALEVNISCPNVKEGGVQFGQDPGCAAGVTRAVKRAAGTTPVMVKLSPNVSDIAAIARAAESEGADMISLINTLSGMAVDVRARRPRLANIYGGLSGPAIKPVALRMVHQVCRAVSVPVVGLGGIVSAEDVLEFILVGATAVQVGTANFLRPDFAFRLVDEVVALAHELGITSWEEYRGSLRQ
jgi:dihydroorotate dehydrogenase (NAD+) catalytic subunit